VPEDLARLLRSAAAGTLLVPDLPAALAAWAERPQNAVTPGGERITVSGAVLGGADGHVLGLLERTAERRALADDLPRLDGQVAMLQEAALAAERAVTESEAQIGRLRQALADHAEERSQGGQALARAEKERAHVLQALMVLRAEAADLAGQVDVAREAAEALATEVRALETARETLEEQAEEAARGYLALEARRKAVSERRMEIRLAVAEATGRAEGARARHDRSAAETADLLARADRLVAEAGDLRRRVDEAEVEIATAEADATAGEGTRVEAGHALVEARKTLADLEAEVGGEEARRAEVHRLHEELRQRLEEFRLKDSELRVRMESLVEQVRQDQGLDLAAVEQETEATEALDLAAMDQEVEDLRQRLDGLGNVNLNAIGELEEVEQHVAFLHAQEKDLLDAKADLEKAITELDAISVQRFAETFETVRENFRNTFRRLFGGGRAEIVLEDAGNLLESGVDIVARPPGKEQRTISLLSGGERTLTAVALLFAVFQAKPSPFTILDEVDAALDEANVRRLIGLVREFTDRSQFLIVTHAKTTMEAADVLYGVTMEEAGVSKKVGVRLTEYPAESVAAG
jgi:chromosome segregation protein